MINVFLWTEWMKGKLAEERGAGMAEYALLLFVIAVAAAGVVTAFGADIMAAFTDATNTLPSDATTP